MKRGRGRVGCFFPCVHRCESVCDGNESINLGKRARLGLVPPMLMLMIRWPWRPMVYDRGAVVTAAPFFFPTRMNYSAAAYTAQRIPCSFLDSVTASILVFTEFHPISTGLFRIAVDLIRLITRSFAIAPNFTNFFASNLTRLYWVIESYLRVFRRLLDFTKFLITFSYSTVTLSPTPSSFFRIYCNLLFNSRLDFLVRRHPTRMPF